MFKYCIMQEHNENEDKDPFPQLQKHKEDSSQFETSTILVPSYTSGSFCIEAMLAPHFSGCGGKQTTTANILAEF